MTGKLATYQFMGEGDLSGSPRLIVHIELAHCKPTVGNREEIKWGPCLNLLLELARKKPALGRGLSESRVILRHIQLLCRWLPLGLLRSQHAEKGGGGTGYQGNLKPLLANFGPVITF
jgi:hypothetical protein